MLMLVLLTRLHGVCNTSQIMKFSRNGKISENMVTYAQLLHLITIWGDGQTQLLPTELRLENLTVTHFTGHGN